MCLSYENISPLWTAEIVEQELERGEKSGKGETGNLWISNQGRAKKDVNVTSILRIP